MAAAGGGVSAAGSDFDQFFSRFKRTRQACKTAATVVEALEGQVAALATEVALVEQELRGGRLEEDEMRHELVGLRDVLREEAEVARQLEDDLSRARSQRQRRTFQATIAAKRREQSALELAKRDSEQQQLTEL